MLIMCNYGTINDSYRGVAYLCTGTMQCVPSFCQAAIIYNAYEHVINITVVDSCVTGHNQEPKSTGYLLALTKISV